MRILAGRFKGRRLKFSKERLLRPTTGLVRKALFDILKEKMPGSSFLDLYAGTGAVGLEALSRGAQRVVLAENEPKAVIWLAENVKLLREAARKEGNEISEQDLSYHCQSVEKALGLLSRKGWKFDVIFADPPYSFGRQKITKLISQILNLEILKPDGVIVLQHRTGMEKGIDFPKEINGFSLIVETRRYGSTSLTFFYCHPSL